MIIYLTSMTLRSMCKSLSTYVCTIISIRCRRSECISHCYRNLMGSLKIERETDRQTETKTKTETERKDREEAIVCVRERK